MAQFVEKHHPILKIRDGQSLLSHLLSGFKSFAIERDDICDNDGAVFVLQMSKKRSRGEGPYNAMLAHLLGGAKALLAEDEPLLQTQTNSLTP